MPLKSNFISITFLYLLAEGAFGQGFPNVAQTPGDLLYGLFDENGGRQAVIAWHNGYLYNAPEIPDSRPGSDLLAKRFDLSDPSNPQTVQILGDTPMPILAHGYMKSGPYLALGPNSFNGNPSWCFRADSPGVTVREDWPDNPNGFSRGTLFGPWNINTYWSYNAVGGLTTLSRNGQALATWNHLGETGVIGHPFIIGNLLIYASDMSRTGVATYDISDPTNPVLLDVLKLGGPGGYWPEIWGGDGKLLIVFPFRGGGNGIRVVDATDPADLRFVTETPLPGVECVYMQFQDHYGFTGDHKVDMRTFQSVLHFDASNAVRDNDGGTGIDTSQFALPLGNLLVTGGLGAWQGMAIWAHQAEPDTRGPSVGYHIPRAGQSNYPVDLGISLLIHETLESATIVPGESIIVRPLGGEPITNATVVFSFDDVLSFVPRQPLLPDTTYEVVIPAGGIEDAAGNGIEAYSFTFSTGAEVGGNMPPVVDSFTASANPAVPGGSVNFEATASDPDLDPLEYRFDFGDGTPRTAWSSVTNADHVYPDSGHFQAKVQVRDPSGVMSTRALTVTVIEPPTGPSPTCSSPIQCDEEGRRVWTVNPDNDTVTALDADSLAVLFEAAVGADPRNLAVDGSGNAWVTCHDADRIDIVSPAGSVIGQVDLDYGDAPFGIVFSPGHGTAWVSLHGSEELARVDVASRTVNGRLALGPTPRALALRGDGSQLYVTRFISSSQYAEVWEVDTASFTLNRSLRIDKQHGDPGTQRDTTANGRGVLNYLAGITLTPDGRPLLVSKKDNTDRGLLHDPEQDLDADNTVRNQLTILTEDVRRPVGIDLDNSDSATAAVFSPLGDYCFVSLQGVNQVMVLDYLKVGQASGFGAAVTQLQSGLAPQGLCVDPSSRRLFVKNFMDRSVSVYELGPLFDTGSINLPHTTVSTVAAEKLAPTVLLGKQIFYNAGDPRMSAEGYISCATCHVDGGHDGRVWDFTGRGEGLRNTITLRGRGGMVHGNVHWSGNFDEIQDFEHDIRNGFGGTGFLNDTQFSSADTPLGPPKTGMSPDLDALAGYLASLGDETLSRSPHRQADGSLSPEGLAGRAVFESMNCAGCHGGPNLSDSTGPEALLNAVGTLRPTSGKRLGGLLPGIDTPTLRGLWNSAPYFHDGSAAELADVFATAGGSVYQAESGTPTNGADIILAQTAEMVFAGSLRAEGGVRLNGEGEQLTLGGIDGGSGGSAQLEIRHSNRFDTRVQVSVNGGPPVEVLLPESNTWDWRHTHWRNTRVENLWLEPGTENTLSLTVEALRDLAIDEILVSTADDLAKAAPHRQVLSLEPADLDQLITFLRELDGSPYIPPVPAEPVVQVLPAPGQTDPFFSDTARFDIRFDRPIQGLETGDFVLSGSAAANELVLMEIDPGRLYRAEVGGHFLSGSITLQLPAGSVTASGTPVPASQVASIQFHSPYPEVDDLAPLSDEFSGASSLADWRRRAVDEGWGIDQLETWNIDQSRSGHMRLVPHGSGWFVAKSGPLAYKEVTGDFIVTAKLDLRNRSGSLGPPDANRFSYAGLMVRRARNMTACAPDPGFGPEVTLPWPPPPEGDPLHYVTDWAPYTENYLYIGLGGVDWRAGNRWQYQTRRSLNSTGQQDNGWLDVPEEEGRVTLQIVRRGSTFLMLRKHEGGAWIIQERYERPDLPATLQVGLTAVTDFFATSQAGLNTGFAFNYNRVEVSAENGFDVNPDLVADADWVRYHRPLNTLTEQMLLEVAVTQGREDVIYLADTTLAGELGDAAAAPARNLSVTADQVLPLVAGSSTRFSADAAVPGPEYRWIVGSGPSTSWSPASFIDRIFNLAGNFTVTAYLRDGNYVTRGSLQVQVVPPQDFASWAAAHGFPGGQPGDPTADGTLIQEYAAALDPAVAEGTPVFMVEQDYSLLVRRNRLAGDLQITVMCTDDLEGNWDEVPVDGINLVEEILVPDLDGDGTAELVRYRILWPPRDSEYFRLRFSLPGN